MHLIASEDGVPDGIEFIDEIKADSLADAPVAERMSIQYLFAWTTATAVLLSLYLAVASPLPAARFHVAIGINVVHFVASVSYGACLALWMFVVKRYFTGKEFPRASGHWIGLILSLKEVLLILVGIVGATTMTTKNGPWFYLFIAPGIATLPAILCWMLALAKARMEPGWKVYVSLRLATETFALFALMLLGIGMGIGNDAAALVLLYPVLQFFAGVCGLAAWIAALVGLLIDATGRRPRDWMHWVGVTAAIAAPLIWFCLWIAALSGFVFTGPDAMPAS